MNATATNELPVATVPPGWEAKVNAILAQTDWVKYGQDVSAAVKKEADAYETARAQSLASASRKFLR